MDHQQDKNLESRVETLTVLFNRFIEKSKKLGGYNAMRFTSPMCDMLLMAVHQLETYEENKKIDDLLNNVLRKSDE